MKLRASKLPALMDGSMDIHIDAMYSSLIDDWGITSADPIGLTMTPKFNEAAIGRLLEHDHELAVKIGFNDCSDQFICAQSKLRKILKLTTNKKKNEDGIISYDISFVVDRKGQRQGQGRFAGNVPGYTGLNRALRGIVGGNDYYWYMDMWNAQPYVLLGLSKL